MTFKFLAGSATLGVKLCLLKILFNSVAKQKKYEPKTSKISKMGPLYTIYDFKSKSIPFKQLTYPPVPNLIKMQIPK